MGLAMNRLSFFLCDLCLDFLTLLGATVLMITAGAGRLTAVLASIAIVIVLRLALVRLALRLALDDLRAAP